MTTRILIPLIPLLLIYLASSARRPSEEGARVPGVAAEVETNPDGAEQSARPEAARSVGYASFEHPRGFTFQYPEDWELSTTATGLFVLPAEVERDAQGQPLAMFLVGAEDASGITRPDQPEVLAWFDKEIAQLLPAMRRSGKPAPLDTLVGAGAGLTYLGVTVTGVGGRADAYVTLHQGLAIFMLHMGRKDLVAAHSSEARRMFASFGWQQGQVDRDLVGSWYGNESSSSSSVGARDGMDVVGASTNRYWEFHADGSVAYTSGRFYGSVGDMSIDDAGGAPAGWRGTWSVSSDLLTVLWSDGSVERYSYKVFAHTEGRIAAKFVPAGTTEKHFYYKQQ